MMLKFTKLSEDASKVIYSIMDGVFGTAKYDKKNENVSFFDEYGFKFESSVTRIAFSKVVAAGFPNEYIYATG